MSESDVTPKAMLHDLLKIDRIQHWLSMGAQASGTVHNLLVSHKVIDAKKVNVLPKKTAPVKEVAPEAPAVEAEAPVEAESAVETPAEAAPESTPTE